MQTKNLTRRPRSFPQIPLVDISPLLRGTAAEQRRVVDELGRAAREVGFFYITGTGFDERLLDDLIGVSKRFFALPLEQRMETYIGRSRNHRGYVPPGEEFSASGLTNRQDYFDVGLELPPDDPDYVAGNPLLGPNQWPVLPGFRAAVTRYYQTMFELGRVLMRAFALSIGEPANFFETYMTKPTVRLLLIHCGPNTGTGPEDESVLPHTDFECITLLRSTRPGLEVVNGDGEWMAVPPVPGAFVVNIGDLLELWTNGEFVATAHRVRRVREERYSFPLFVTVDYHTRVEPLERFVSPERPARGPLVAGGHVFAELLKQFTYLRERLERGEIELPDEARSPLSFGPKTAALRSEPIPH